MIIDSPYTLDATNPETFRRVTRKQEPRPLRLTDEQDTPDKARKATR